MNILMKFNTCSTLISFMKKCFLWYALQTPKVCTCNFELLCIGNTVIFQNNRNKFCTILEATKYMSIWKYSRNV